MSWTSSLFHLVALVCSAGAPFAASARSTQDPPITWRGCGITEKAFMAVCAEAYERETGQRVLLSASGATQGVRSVAAGSADLGGTCRHCLPEDFGPESGAKLAIIAWDALVAMTHPSNTVDGLSRGDLVEILSGRTTNWLDAGGADERIVVCGRKEDESGVGVMERLMIFRDPSFEYPRDSVLLRSSGPLESFVERTPGSIVVTGVSSARKRAAKVLEIDGVAPTAQAIASGAYPYFRPLYLVYRPEGDERVLSFVRWMLGEKGQATIANQGTVPLEQGLPLMTKFEHWQRTETISNYEELMRRARALETIGMPATGPGG